MSFKANLLALSLILTCGVGVTTPATAEAPAERGAQKPALTVIDYQIDFSPNHDHRKDVARVRYRLGAPAYVSVEVLKGRRVIRRAALGRRTAGRQVFIWNGRNRAGRMMDDSDKYRIRISAKARGTVTKKAASVRLDTDGSGDLITSRRTVYPKATLVKDAVQLVFVYAGWEDEDWLYTDRIQERSRLRIINDGGKVVWKESSRNDGAPNFTWQGLTKSGRALPTGTYRAKFFTVDEVGNPFRATRRLTVSHEQLVEQTSTQTVQADSPSEYISSSGGCNDCGVHVEPVASKRFPGGLSFRPTGPDRSGLDRPVSIDLTMPAPVLPAPVDTYRVSAAGGPTTVGGADIGTLSANGQYTETAVGDSTTTTEWAKVHLNRYPYLPAGTQPVEFGFSTTPPASYDVASFTIEYRYYVPAGG